jgi:group II intron reverse transcriptase/maturase
MGGGWVLDVDLRKFFDTLDHGRLRQLLAKRMRDGVIERLIGKWLNAGVMEDGRLTFPEAGTPQGGVISPLLANVYLHEVVDTWFVEEVRPRMKGEAFLVRYADDLVMGFECGEDAERVWAVLAKRLEKYGLRLNADKTRLLDFRRPKGDAKSGGNGPRSFDFLGFTHYWARSRKGNWVVKQKTAQSRFTRALLRIKAWCRTHRHRPVREQWETLSAKLRGHYGYYGITGNFRSLGRFRNEVCKLWRKWLSRRSQKSWIDWPAFTRLLMRYPLPAPRVIHSIFRSAANP